MKFSSAVAVAAAGLTSCASTVLGSGNMHLCHLNPAVANDTWPAAKRADGFRECPTKYVYRTVQYCTVV